MNSKELIKVWRKEEKEPFSGWDFSHLDGRMLLEQLPWSYTSRAVELMHCYSSVLDMGTGGGELLLQFKADWPKRVTVTEEYLPNFELATKRLIPLGVRVVDVKLSEADLMPFDDNEYELILNRHSGFNPSEVARIMAPGGVFLTQHSTSSWAIDL